MARRDCTWLGREDHVELDFPQIGEVRLCVGGGERGAEDCIWQKRKDQVQIDFQIYRWFVNIHGEGQNK